MPTNKFYHILCTSGDKVVYEGRFQCVSRSAAMKLLREKVGRQNLYGLIYTVTEIPIEILREIVDALYRIARFEEINRTFEEFGSFRRI